MGLLYCPFFRDGFLKVIQGLAQAGFEIDLWFPLQQPASLGDIGTTLLRIILWQRFVANLTLGSRHLQDQLGAIQDREFVRIADIDGQMFV